MMTSTYVLKCCSCNVFQVQQQRTDKKFACKLCGTKQSVKKVYYEGNGRNCRETVQRLNMDMHSGTKTASSVQQRTSPPTTSHQSAVFKRKSKWSEFIEDSSDDEHESLVPKKAKFNDTTTSQKTPGNVTFSSPQKTDSDIINKYNYDEEVENLLDVNF